MKNESFMNVIIQRLDGIYLNCPHAFESKAKFSDITKKRSQSVGRSVGEPVDVWR